MADQEKDVQKFSYYHYDPSLGGELTFTVIFALITIGHLAWIVTKKTWYFIPFLIGCLCKSFSLSLSLDFLWHISQVPTHSHQWIPSERKNFWS